MSTVLNELVEICQNSYQNLYEVCSVVLQFTFSQKKSIQASCVAWFLGEGGLKNLLIEDPESFFADEILSLISDDIDNLGNRILENLVRENGTEKDFYDKIWNKLSDRTLFPDREAQTAFLMKLCLDPRLPYFQLEEGCKMEQDVFEEIAEHIHLQLTKARFILTVPIKQRTQQASLLMKLTEGMEEEEKTVFWVNVISMVEDYSGVMAEEEA